jgi:chorismate mutase
MGEIFKDGGVIVTFDIAAPRDVIELAMKFAPHEMRFDERVITQFCLAILAERRRCAEAVTRLKGGQYIDMGAAQSAILNP